MWDLPRRQDFVESLGERTPTHLLSLNRMDDYHTTAWFERTQYLIKYDFWPGKMVCGVVAYDDIKGRVVEW